MAQVSLSMVIVSSEGAIMIELHREEERGMGVDTTVVGVGGSGDVGGCCHRGSNHACGGRDNMSNSRESGWGGCGGGACGLFGIVWNGRVEPGRDQQLH